MSKKKKRLVLIDGNALIHRAFHALPPLTSPKGELTNAVYGFTSVLLKVLEDLKPDYILATFDLKGPTFRHEEFQDYKATRVKAPDELYAQIGRVKEVVRAFNIPIYELSGFEADDVIGTMVHQCEALGCAPSGEELESIIVTGDLDVLQLVSPHTKAFMLRRGMSDTVIYDEEKVRERYGLLPKQMIDYKGFRGDPSDNIPGVKGIGEKTAIELLTNYASLEEVYENLDKLKPSVREKLERDKMQAIMSKRLATIRRDVPVELNLEKTTTHDFDREKVIALFQELGFVSLVKRIPEAGVPLRAKTDKLMRELEMKFDLVSGENIEKLVKELEKAEEIAIALNARGEKYFDSEVTSIAFAESPTSASCVEVRPNTLEKFRGILENENIKKIGYDLKAISEVLSVRGIEMRGADFDVMLAAYVMAPGANIELPSLVLQELGEELEEEKKGSQLGLLEDPQDLARRVCQRANFIFQLKTALQEKMTEIAKTQDSKRNLLTVFRDLEMPLVEVLKKMEMWGVCFNGQVFKEISGKVNARIEKLEKKIWDLAGEEFNLNSPKQLAEILFEKLKIPTNDVKKLKTGYSTAAGELAKLRDKHKIIESIEEYREIFKLKTTYLDTLPNLVDEQARIHTNFNQAVTATGRLSSSDPNLQNIPIRTDLGQLLRGAFEAEKGWKLIGADYSQIDLRVVAHVSGDGKMIETFRKGEDVHRATAAEINKVPLSQVTEKMRSKAKALNFGIIYGMSVFGFSARTGVDREEARVFIDEYMKKFSGVARYMQETKERARVLGYVETEMGRRRYVPEINSSNFQVAAAGERMAINMPIQGLAADIMKLAMLKIQEEFARDENVKMVLQVHDEIILEVKESETESVAKKVKEIMENAYELKVPLLVDVQIGNNWGEI